MRNSIVIAGALAQRPQVGGHTWVFLQFLLGFRQLGWSVLLLDHVASQLCRDEAGRPAPLDHSVNLRYLREVLQAFDLGDAYSLDYDHGSATAGLPRDQVLDRVRQADLFLNINGFLTDEEILGQAATRIFLDIDPGFNQMWSALGQADLFAGHHVVVTVAENIGAEDCSIPTCNLPWITTPQPVVLDQWPNCPRPGGAFTSVTTWRGVFDPIEYNGRTYGLRVHEFRKFVELPALTGERFELALDIDPEDARDRELLASKGWQLVEPSEVACDPWRYRQFVQASGAEFMIAKSMYVGTNSGWMSDRSLCYLASGKPVLAQETGFSRNYPVGRGLLSFRTPADAAAGVEEIRRDPSGHARAARELAEEYFDARQVLSRLVDRVTS